MGSGTSEADARREELEARNAGLRSQIDSMLSDLRRRTAQLGEKRAEATQRTTEVTSRDGMVTATVGTVQELTLSAKAFERTTPERLGHTITSVLREAAGRSTCIPLRPVYGTPVRGARALGASGQWKNLPASVGRRVSFSCLPGRRMSACSGPRRVGCRTSSHWTPSCSTKQFSAPLRYLS